MGARESEPNGAAEGWRAVPRERGSAVLYFISPVRATTGRPANLVWTQGRGVDHPRRCIRSPQAPGPEREGRFLGQKRHPGWWQPKTPSAGELGLWAVPVLSRARRRMLSHPFSAARARPLFFPLAEGRRPSCGPGPRPCSVDQLGGCTGTT